LSTTEELFLNVKPSGGMDWVSHIKPSLRRFLSLPGLHSLLPAARKAATVISPIGRLSFKSHPSKPTGENCKTITVLSANLCHDWPRHRLLRERLEAVAQLIESERVDVALLQEVTRTSDFRADEWLGERLGMAYVYSRANGHEMAVGFEEGLALFSKFPLTNPVLTELKPGSPITRRLGLGAKVETRCGELQIFSTHLGLIPSHNVRQLNHLHDWINEISAGAITLIGGDFNTHEISPQIKKVKQNWIDIFRHLHPKVDGTTHEIYWPWGGKMRRRRLDYLFLQPGNQSWRIINALHLDAPGGPHSDHRAVLARLEFGN